MQKINQSVTHRQLRWLFAGLSLLSLALLLAWVSAGFQDIRAWLPFLSVLLLAGGLLFLGWLSIRDEAAPGWLGWIVLGAAVVRLAAGMSWYMALPELGYHSPGEQAGYVMADAFERDQAAWDLAVSEKPLQRAFQGGYRKADQYGGLLFLSAVIYRYMGSEVHTPLLMVVVTASFSALAVLYTWGFARRAWGAQAGAVSALALALYPEAVLIGSSQMREAFTITLVAAAFYGLLRFWQERSWKGIIIIVVSLVSCLPFSPPFTALVLLALGVEIVALGWAKRRTIFSERVTGTRWLWLVLGGVTLLAVTGLWLSWKNFAPPGITNPFALIGWWIRKSAEWQAHLSERASGWMQKIFDSTPAWMHLPLLLVYGVVQPFLPAALVDVTGAAIWQAIAIWRALGWTLILPFMIYAPLRAIRGVDRDGREDKSRAPGVIGLSLVVWIVILVASYRSGGDQWDNPRYRAAFASLQIALLAWVWAAQRRRPDPWLGRALVASGLMIAWFVPWYLRRYLYLPWPVVDLFKTTGLGVASTLLYFIWVQARGSPTNRR